MACLTPDIIIHNHNNLICGGCDKQRVKKIGQEQKASGIIRGGEACGGGRNCDVPNGKVIEQRNGDMRGGVINRTDRSNPAEHRAAWPQPTPQQSMPPICGVNYVPEPGSAALFGIGAAAMLAGLHLVGVRLT